VNLLNTWGVTPAAVVGHSSGEIAAAYASGAITTDTAIIIAYYRGLVTKKQTRRGKMAAIGMGRDEVASYLVNGVVIACENSPSSVTLSGDEGKLANIIGEIKSKQPEVFIRHLKVEMAYHSRESHTSVAPRDNTQECKSRRR
jgi:acyl transferase domain-containing protein